MAPPRSSPGAAAGGRPRVVVAALGLAALGAAPVAATEWFDVTEFRAPTQCERMSCLSIRLEHCRDYLHGFYLREKGCGKDQMCTNCAHGNMTTPAMCYCENPPYSVKVSYGQACGLGKECEEGICFRPCYTFLSLTTCPQDYCMWDSFSKTCLDKPAADAEVSWLMAQDGPTRPIIEESQDILLITPQSVFPMSFHTFQDSALGFRISGILIDDLISLKNLFLEMDVNTDGLLTAEEYASLPEVLQRVESQANQLVEDADQNDTDTEERRLSLLGLSPEEDADGADGQGRRLYNATISPETCGTKRPREFYCSFDVSCKSDCRECGWKSATDTAFATCVRPTADTCWADGKQVFCESDQLCHPPGDCSNCADRPIVDHAQHMCLQLWWASEPLTQMRDWVCRPRNKNGMPCRSDQDCIYGLKRCLSGECQPFQPYNPQMTCVTDLDCPHIGYYCPADPTGGENQFWVQYCREQGDEMSICAEDRECKPDLRCNTAEGQPRCRRLFSLPLGLPAKDDILCEHGWRDRELKCATPAKSKQLAQPCDSDEDCETTDPTGRSGECVCKQWWEYGDPKLCNPVSGDYSHHQERLRDYLFFRASRCGGFWTEMECLRIFGNQALRLKLALDCEKQELIGGPLMPDPDCGIVDDDRFPDYCQRLAALG